MAKKRALKRRRSSLKDHNRRFARLADTLSRQSCRLIGLIVSDESQNRLMFRPGLPVR